MVYRNTRRQRARQPAPTGRRVSPSAR